jgi:hypothetical protein
VRSCGLQASTASIANAAHTTIARRSIYGAIVKAAVRLCALEPSPCSTSTRQK